MKRTNLLLATVGGSAVLAVAGVALGVNAANDPRTGGTALAAATVAPTATDAPEVSGSPSASGTPSAGTPSGTPSSGTPSAGTSPAGSAVDEKRAGEIALAKAGGGQIVEVEAEQENGRPVWSVEILAGDTEHEVDVDRDNGSVVKAEQEPVDDDDNDADDNDDDADDKDDDNDDD
ncbi:PepSY domain-containing protein [Micromonospora sp. LAH09]|uniref:PepSY domain-containing protein n=1 Tax=Micromonospora cabrerizensis TaxID=2911213 RepID=UPI001EE7D1FC|nr:PepSY domain-containing protein [Micromonospora cabrerizensis]MCG5471815.1 PepSY domain-containing protein [Micromonospora cabrerizensis]